jgi:pimeloyl-ACP methyl ester carboxylesterase
MEARQAFVHTVRGIMDISGQRVSARDRLYLAATMPTLLIWGQRDRMIPVAHGRAAQEAMPGSRCIVYEDAGHFPHLDDPWRFASDLLEFMDATAPASVEEADVRALMQQSR